MGSLFSRLKKLYILEKPREVSIIGLDSAGKTTILYRMKHQSDVQTIPTIGFNIESITVGNTEFNVWDIGGQDDIRGLWGSYVDLSHGIIFVIDIQDDDRWNQAGKALQDILVDEYNAGKPILILANKADNPFDPNLPKTIEALRGHLPLNPDKHNFEIFHCAAKESDCNPNPLERLFKGFEWMSKMLKDGKTATRINPIDAPIRTSNRGPG